MAESVPVRPQVVVVVGPTASGKTALAIEMARHWPIEVVSADSRQVYRGLDVGTGKATAAERALAPHHLIDLIEPDASFTVADAVREGRAAIDAILARGHRPWIVGGTGLYVRGILRGLAPTPPGDPELRAQLARKEEAEGPGALYRWLQQVDPEQAQSIHPNNLVRITRALEVFLLSGRPLSQYQREHAFAESPYDTLQLAWDWPLPELFARIDRRCRQMLEDGLVEETQALLQRFPEGCRGLETLGYREVARALRGEYSLEQAREELVRQTRAYARRQLTWFRAEEGIKWLASSDTFGSIQALIAQYYES